MRWPLSILLFCAVASAQSIPENLLPSADAPANSALPPLPPGRTTVMGGEIQKVDLVRDRLALKVAGGHAVDILFDERTQIYQNGKKMSVLALHPEDHASIETTLDGTNIFAVRIHTLTDLPDGHIRAQVLSYNRQTHELKLQVTDSKNPLTLETSDSTPVQRIGEGIFAQQKGAGAGDLVRGALVDVTFQSKSSGPGTATQISVLAIPGAEFVVLGPLVSLDVRAGRMSIGDQPDNRPFDISFDPARFAVAHQLHQGAQIKVTARFDGIRYIALDIAAE